MEQDEPISIEAKQALIKAAQNVLEAAKRQLEGVDFISESDNAISEREICLEGNSEASRVYLVTEHIFSEQSPSGNVYVNGFEKQDGGQVKLLRRLVLPNDPSKLSARVLRMSGHHNLGELETYAKDLQTGVKVDKEEWEKANKQWETQRKEESEADEDEN